MLATPANSLPALAAQAEGIQWQQDLEAAKTLAKQTGRLVLVHFWTPTCAPCLTLDETVFNQAGVAAAVEARFVPVKLNANENSATAQGFGITRVPTDVILTPDGHVVGKLISPPTPGGYVAELTQVASAYAATPGQSFANAAAKAPAPSQLNAAYASLPVAANALPAAPLFGNSQTTNGFGQPPITPTVQPAATPFAQSSPFPPPAAPVNAASQAPLGAATPQPSAAITPIGSPQPAAPVITNNPMAAAPVNGYGLPAAASSTPGQVENRYAAAPPFSPPAAAQPTSPAWPTASAPVGQVSQGGQAPQVGQAPTLISGTSSASLTFRTDGTQPQAAQSPQQSSITVQPAVGDAAVDTRQLPPGSPPLGFDGYCPVSMRNSWKWVPGDPRWGIVHRGRTYWFAGQTEQQQFWSDPDRFSPALSGMDPVMAIDHQQQVPGKREHSIDYDSLFYMFSSEATLAQFTANPERYAAGVRQAMGIPRGRLVR